MIRHILIFVLVQFVAGRSVDLEYGYQEIEGSISKNNLDETNRLETLELLCENLRGRIYVKELDTHVDCLESLFEDSREVKLVKRDTEKNEEIEGSGDSDDQKLSTLEPEATVNASEVPFTSEEKILETSSTISPETTTPSIIIQKEYEASSTGTPPMFKHGFDDILKKFPSQQLHVNLTKSLNLPETAKNDLKEESPAQSPTNNKPPIVAAEEIVKTGASEEKQSGISANNIFLLILGLLGVVGVLAFAFNYVRKKREDKEVDEVIRQEAEERELKEMKPLMKNTLTQNGARSLEFIDAEPQNGNGIETKAEVNHNQDVEQHS